MGVPAMGHQAKMGMAATAPATEAYEFISESLKKEGSHFQGEGMRGTRSRHSEYIADGLIAVGGQITMHARPAELTKIIERALGGAAVVNVHNPTETLPDFVVVIDRLTKVFTYTGMKVNRAAFRSSKGGPLEVVLDVAGKAESVGAAGTFPALTLSLQQPYMHHQAVITLAGAAREADNVEIVVDNALILDRYYNSQTRTQLPEGDRIVLLSCDAPYTPDEVALYGQVLGGAAGSIVYTNGAKSIQFSFAALQVPDRSPVAGARGSEVVLPLQMVARKLGATNEIVVTSVP